VYEVVAVALNGNTAYGPTVVQGVKTGTSLGKVTVAQTGGGGQKASFDGTIANNSGVAVDYTVSALQQATINGASTMVTVPLAVQQSATLNVVTDQTGGTCLPNTNCKGYSMALPAANIAVGTIGNNGTISYLSATSAPTYTVEAHATSTTTHADTCALPVQTVTSPSVSPGGSYTLPVLNFSNCTQ
jgi:hypothetical protein